MAVIKIVRMDRKNLKVTLDGQPEKDLIEVIRELLSNVKPFIETDIDVKGLSAEDAKKKIAEARKDHEKDLNNRLESLRLLFINFADGFLKSGKDGTDPNDWVYLSTLLYKDNVTKTGFSSEGFKPDSPIDNARFGSLVKNLTSMPGSDSKDHNMTKYAFKKPILDQSGFHSDILEKKVGEDSWNDVPVAELNGIDDVNFGSDGKFIIDNLKNQNLKNKDVVVSPESLLKVFSDVSSKQVRNYNAAAMLIFFGIIVLSQTENIIKRNFDKQKEINNGILESIEKGNFDFSSYKNFRYESDSKPEGTFDFRVWLEDKIEEILGIKNGSASEPVKALYGKFKTLFGKDLSGLDLNGCDKFEKTKIVEVEESNNEFYYGDIEDFEKDASKYQGPGLLDGSKLDPPVLMDKEFFDNKVKNVKFGGFNHFAFKKDGTLGKESENKIFEEYKKHFQKGDGVALTNDDEKFVMLYSKIEKAFSDLGLLKSAKTTYTGKEIDVDKFKKVAQDYYDKLAKCNNLNELDKKFSKFIAIYRFAGRFTKLRNCLVERAKYWCANIAPNKKDFEGKISAVIKKEEYNKMGWNDVKGFPKYGLDTDKLYKIFVEEKENELEVKLFSQKVKGKEKVKKTIPGTSVLEYFGTTFTDDKFEKLSSEKKIKLVSDIDSILKNENLGKSEKVSLEPLKEKFWDRCKDMRFNNLITVLGNGNLEQQNIDDVKEFGNLSEDQKKETAKTLVNAISNKKYDSFVNPNPKTDEALKENAKFLNRLLVDSDIFCFDETQKNTLESFIKSIAQENLNVLIQQAYNSGKRFYSEDIKFKGEKGELDTKDIKVSGDSALQDQISSLSTKNADLEKKLKEANENKDAVQKSFDNYKKDHPDSGGTGGGSGDTKDKQKIKDLEDQLQAAKKDLDDYKKDHPDSSGTGGGSGDTKDKQRIKSLEEQLKTAQKNFDDYKASHPDSGGTGGGSGSGSGEPPKNIAELEQNLKDAQSQLGQKSSELAKKTKEYDDIKKSYDALLQDQQNVGKKQEEINELNKKLKEVQASGGDINKIQKELEEKKEELESAKNAQNLLNEKEKTINELSDKYVKLEDEKQKVEAELEKRENELKKLKDSAAEGADAAVKVVIENLNAKTEELESKLETLEEEKKKLVEDAKKTGIEIKEIKLNDDQIKAIQEGAKDPEKRGKAMDILGAALGGTGFLAGAGGIALVLIFTTGGTLAFPLLLGGSGLMAVLGGFGFGKSIANLRQIGKDESKELNNSGIFKRINESGLISKETKKTEKPKTSKESKNKDNNKTDTKSKN